MAQPPSGRWSNQEKRFEFEQALALYAALQKAGFKKTVFAVFSADRVGRDSDVVMRLAKSETRTLFASMPGLDLSSPAGILALQVFAAIAEHDRKNILAKTQAGRAVAKARREAAGTSQAITKPMSAVSSANKKASFAWKQKLAKASRAFVEAGYSLGEIAKRLNEAGYTTFKITYPSGFTVGGGKVTASYVSQIMHTDGNEWLRQLWSETLERRSREYEVEQMRKAEQAKAEKKAKEALAAQMKASGMKRSAAMVTGGQARALLGRGLGVTTPPSRPELANNPNAKKPRVAGDAPVDLDN